MADDYKEIKNGLRTLAMWLYSVVLTSSVLLLSVFLYVKSSLWAAAIGLFMGSLISVVSILYFIGNKYPSEIYLSDSGVRFSYTGRPRKQKVETPEDSDFIKWEDIKRIYISGDSDAFSSRIIFLRDGGVKTLNFVSLNAVREIMSYYENISRSLKDREAK